MEETGEKGIFLGVLTYTDVEPEGNDSYACRVCGKGIVSFGIHVVGWIVSPDVQKLESAEWRFGATSEIFPGDEKILSQENIPGAIRVDFYCHDYHCFAMFLRNHFPIDPSILAYGLDAREPSSNEHPVLDSDGQSSLPPGG